MSTEQNKTSCIKANLRKFKSPLTQKLANLTGMFRVCKIISSTAFGSTIGWTFLNS